MKVHVLSGDSLVKPFLSTGIEGEHFVCRECFVDGPIDAPGLNELWEVRAAYLDGENPEAEQDYNSKVVDEFVRLWNKGDGNEVILWFERELFCQANLWFTVWLMRNTNARFSIAYPKLNKGDSPWKGFSYLDTEELLESYDTRVKMNHDDAFLAVGLWETFQKRDFESLSGLSQTVTDAFPTLKEVVAAACEIDTRPKRSLRKIIESGKSGFGDAFKEFCEVEAIYGFGDLQVKRLYDGIIDG